MNPILFHTHDYRGATIEDLDIKPAISISPRTLIYEALEVLFANEFTYLPVVNEQNRRLLGILNVELIRANYSQIQRSSVEPIVMNYMVWFHPSARLKYQLQVGNKGDQPVQLKKAFVDIKGKYIVLTPFTPLEELAAFFNSGQYFAIVTNHDGDMVYGVATPEDLVKYEKSRPKL